MSSIKNIISPSILFCLLICVITSPASAQSKSTFKVIAFYTAKHDLAHISFVHEANKWFTKISKQYYFIYDSTNNWDNLNEKFLANYQVVLFLDTRPDSVNQRKAFENYMNHGGAWMGFHFAGFALTPSDYPQNWDWYHNTFLGTGEYKSNTWHPTSAILKKEGKHPATRRLSKKFKTAPNEWYSWQNDLRKNPDIKILLSVDSASFPLGNGPKLHEIWHRGDYPVAWTNKKYKMIYMNMGHNDMDYDHKTNKQLSSTFESDQQNAFIIDALLWLGNSSKQTIQKINPEN